MSIAVAVGPAAFSGAWAGGHAPADVGAAADAGALLKQGITLNPSDGPPGRSVDVGGDGFGSCRLHTATGDTTREIALRVDLTWDGGEIGTQGTVDENGNLNNASFEVPEDATEGGHLVVATCYGPRGEARASGSATFTVVRPAPTESVLTLDPADGRAEGTVQATGSGFNCESAELLWEEDALGTADVLEDYSFSVQFEVPDDASVGPHPVRAQCVDDPEVSAEADFTVTRGTGTDGGTDAGTDGGGTDGGGTDGGGTDGGGTDGGGTDGGGTGGETSTPAAWVVGPASLGGVLLLAAGAFAFMSRWHRGPRWVRSHVRTALRTGAASADVSEQTEPGAGATRSVRLEPHTDPGDQTIDEVDR